MSPQMIPTRRKPKAEEGTGMPFNWREGKDEINLRV
jgi:hypothetical protein